MNRSHFHDDSFDLRWLRSAMDLTVCFVLAVIMLRAFVLEGYLISTGSMAPGLLGFHRRIECPSCRQDFAFGVSFDESVADGSGQIVEPEGARRYATCPNCGQINIDVSGVPNSHGDQLLVQKHVYDLRRPCRWEPIVFRNPASPGEAYVKRVIALPGERIQILNGDVYINGRIARKGYPQQLAMRIPVSDLRHPATAEGWQIPWELDEAWERSNESLELTPMDSGCHWIRFRNWRWYGGHHIAETPLASADAEPDWQNFLARFDSLPITWVSRVNYDADRQVLQCEGVMPDDMQADLLAEATGEEFRRAVYRLAALSHLAPVTDRYGYNAMVASPEFVVSDLMLDTELVWTTAPEAVRIQIPCGAETFGLVVQPGKGSVQLISMQEEQIVRAGQIPQSSESAAGRLQIQVSNFDQQITVAVDGAPVFDSLSTDTLTHEEALEATVSSAAGQKIDADKAAKISLRMEQQNRWALGVTGGSVQVTELKMFRDVFYTPGRKVHAVETEFTVPPNSYFVQGDNSPVSSDSRNWKMPCVSHHLLLGKPFLVHLPSRPATLQLGKWEWPVRIPDWRRIRYIR